MPLLAPSLLALLALLTPLPPVLATSGRPLADVVSPDRGVGVGVERVRYRPPAEAPVVDPFRAPAHTYGPGNRGLEYATRPGQPVHAVGEGRVAFAGPVAGRLVVSIDHPDGLRSSLTGLATVAVTRGATVVGGDVVGTAGSTLHLGVRRDGTYLDPASLFAAGAGVHLVPLDDPAPAGTDVDAAPSTNARSLTVVRCPPACR